MPREQKPMQSFGYGKLLEPELEKFRKEWQGPSPTSTLTSDSYLMLIVHWPDCVDAGPRGDGARRAYEKLRQDYPDCYKDEPRPPDYAAAVRFAALYAEFPDFVAGWLNHARKFLTSTSPEAAARRWLLTNFQAKRPKYEEGGKLSSEGGEIVSVFKLQQKEICDVIQRDTGTQISVSSLRRVRDELIGQHRFEQELARLFHAWLEANPDMQKIPLEDAERAFKDEMMSEG